MITFTLPEPPSVNHFKSYAPNGRPFSNKRYSAWKKAAGWELASQRVTQPGRKLLGAVQIEIIFARNGDLDNRIKPLLDLLQEMRVYENDRQVEKLIAQFGEPAGRCRVIITEMVLGPSIEANAGR